MNADAPPEVSRGPADVGVKGGTRRGGAEESGEEGAVVAVAETAAAIPWEKTTEAWSP